MITRLLDLDPYAMFLAYVFILGALTTLAAAVDVARTRRSSR